MGAFVSKMEEKLSNRLCKRCNVEKPLNAEFWYVQRARDSHPTPGWQSHCRECWREINRTNKQKRRLAKRSNVGNGFPQILDPISVITPSKPVTEVVD